MELTTAQLDRAVGVVVGSAAGDALGAGYEFTDPGADLVPDMIGGGLGGFAPGEWTDDTAQAMSILRVAASGLDLRSVEALDQVAEGFADWFAGGPSDVGVQTRRVLRLAGRNPSASQMRAAAAHIHEETGRSAGNGSLMRTGPVALAYLDDPAALVEAAMAVSSLTHFDPLAGEASALWCLWIRHAVLTGEFGSFDDVVEWMPNADHWRSVVTDAESSEPNTFAKNGWAVGALQAAWSAIRHTSVPDSGDDCGHLVDALGTAIRIGHDTDTVAAIAGALLGARWGASAVPARWRRILHGWPTLDSAELERFAFLAARGGAAGVYGWPQINRIDYSGDEAGQPALARHPFDDGVWLSSASLLDDLPEDVDAVVSLCLVGRNQVPEGIEAISFRLIDEASEAKNPNLDFVLTDAAQTVADLRDEGKVVLLHCVAAHSRTPTVGTAYAMLRGVPLNEALPAVCGVLPAARPNSGFEDALRRLEPLLRKDNS
jgi:ADP-ribosyl-[dinitrogen reductase] hydrolase